jgi:hypothetical protein
MTRISLQSSVCLLFLSFSVLLVKAQEEYRWSLERDEEEIKIYNRSVPGSDYCEFMAVTYVKASPDQIIELILNNAEFKSVLPNCKTSKTINRINSEEQYLYIENDLPFPFQNRDMIYLVKVDRTSDSQLHVIELKGKPGYLPPKKGIVRMKSAYGQCRMFKQKDGILKVEYQLHAEPGGIIPSWLVNLKAIDSPFLTLKNIRNELYKRSDLGVAGN